MINDELQQVLLYQFFALLDQQALDDGRAFVGMLAQRCSTEPTLQPLYNYCATLLVQVENGEFAMAQQRYQQLLTAELDPFLEGVIWASLATAQMQLADFRGSQRATQRAITLFQRLKLPLEMARSLTQQGLAFYRAYQAGNRNEESLTDGVECCQGALAHLQKLPINQQTGYVWVQLWQTLGHLYTALRRWNEALNAYLAIVPIADQIQNYAMVAFAQYNSAKIRRQFGEGALSLAAEELETALTLFRELERDDDLFRTLADAALVQMGRNEHQAALAYLDEALALVATVQSRIVDDQAQAAFQATHTDLYANAALCAVESNQPARAFTYVEQAHSHAARDRLRQTEAPATLPQVQAALPAKTLLLAYFTIGVAEAAAHDQTAPVAAERTTFPPAATLLFAITTKTVASYRLALAPHEINRATAEESGEAHFGNDALCTLRYDQLIRPALAHLAGKQTLLIIPHGPLHAVPFPALRDETGRTLLSIGGPRVIFASRIATLLRNRSLNLQHVYRPGDSNTALVIGYNGNTTAPRVYAEAEAARIGAVTQGQTLIGPHPKMAELSQRTAAAQIIHFACQGYFHGTTPRQAVLQIGGDERLTAQQVADELKLLAAPLVILSAHANGLTGAHRGDEHLSLVRAFFAAGAAALVVPQWGIDERAIYLLMSKFYERLRQGEELATALHQAQFYLQRLTVADLLRIVPQIRQNHPRLDATLTHALDELTAELLCLPPTNTPFAAPAYWAPLLAIYG